MATVRLYGSLKQFGERFQLEVRDTADALRALCAQLNGFRQALQNGQFKVRIGRDYLDNRFLEKGLFYRLKPHTTIHITPVIKGAKKAGVFQTILGAVLVVVGALTSWAGGGYLCAVGVSLMLGGVAQMLTKTPSMNSGNTAEKKQSTAFSNLQNMAAQGRPVPLAYGRIRVGSLIISQGVETFDVEKEERKANRKAGFAKGRM